MSGIWYICRTINICLIRQCIPYCVLYMYDVCMHVCTLTVLWKHVCTMSVLCMHAFIVSVLCIHEFRVSVLGMHAYSVSVLCICLACLSFLYIISLHIYITNVYQLFNVHYFVKHDILCKYHILKNECRMQELYIMWK